jgi:DNA-binding MarR family transcriptional regulator
MALPTDPTRLAQEIDRDLRAIRERIRRPLEADIARGNLTGPQQSVMHALVQSEGLSLKDLSAHLGLSHSTVSGIIDRLVERGLVERRIDENDRRITRIRVTRRVRNYLKDRLPGLAIHPILAALSRATLAEREAIDKGLKTLRGLLEVPNEGEA